MSIDQIWFAAEEAIARVHLPGQEDRLSRPMEADTVALVPMREFINILGTRF